jgi:hypothetical protein
MARMIAAGGVPRPHCFILVEPSDNPSGYELNGGRALTRRAGMLNLSEPLTRLARPWALRRAPSIVSCIGDSALVEFDSKSGLQQPTDARRIMTITSIAMGTTRSVPIVEQSKAKTMLRHPTLGVGFLGALSGDGTVSEYRGIPYGKLEKRWTRAVMSTHQPDLIIDGRKFG